MAAAQRKKPRKPPPRKEPGPAAPCVPPIPVNARRMIRNVVIFCVAAEVLFVFLDATVNYSYWTDYGMIRRLCNIAREDGLASWFGTTQTFMVACTLWLIFVVARRDADSKWVPVGWMVLAIFFTYMAADDGAEIHERLGSAFRKAHETNTAPGAQETLGARALEFFPSYAWQVVFMPLFGAMGIFMVVFLWRQLELPVQRGLLLTALVLFALAVSLDFVEGLDDDHPWNLYTFIADRYDIEPFTLRHFRQDAFDALRHFSKSIEEFMEMYATTLLWAVFLGHFARRAGDFHLRFTDLPGETTEA